MLRLQGVEAAEFLGLLPRKHAVGEGFVSGGGHCVFGDGGDVSEVGSGEWWASVVDLG